MVNRLLRPNITTHNLRFTVQILEKIRSEERRPVFQIRICKDPNLLDGIRNYYLDVEPDPGQGWLL
jgi:hypothetical protein